MIFLLLCACKGGPLDNPYSTNAENDNTFYADFNEQPKTLDPAKSYTAYEVIFTAQIYEPPLQYDYLKRPYELVPLTATHIPSPIYLNKEGKPLTKNQTEKDIAYSRYDIEIRPGIFYQPHPAFVKAKLGEGEYLYHHLTATQLGQYKKISDFPEMATRELTADDYVYQIKRLADPKLGSPIFGVMSRYIVGLSQYGDLLQNKKESYVDLRQYPLIGAQTIDRYHYRIFIKGKYPQFLYWLAMPFFAPIPWEADKFYSQEGMDNYNLSFDWYPVGTGAYQLTTNNPNRQMILEKNPNFHTEYFSGANQILSLPLKKLPQIDRFIFTLEKETIPRWNKFLQGYYDQSGIGTDSFDTAIKVDKEGNPTLTQGMKEKNMRLQTSVDPAVYYMGFNMLDDVVGGTSDRAKKLRQAISIAVDFDEFVDIFLNGRGVAAQGPIPLDVFGYEPLKENFNAIIYEKKDNNLQRKSLVEAKKLLSEAGYPNGQDEKTGAPLILNYDAIDTGSPDDRARFSWVRKQFSKLGIALQVRATQYNRFQEKLRTGNTQIFFAGWSADYPDPENFLFLLTSDNSKVLHGGENVANYKNETYDDLFDKMKSMPNNPERQKIINQMVAIVQEDMPIIWGYYPKTFQLIHAWNEPRKPSAIINNTLKYAKIDPALRATLRAQWNTPVLWPIALIIILLVLGLIPVIVRYRQKENSPVQRLPFS